MEITKSDGLVRGRYLLAVLRSQTLEHFTVYKYWDGGHMLQQFTTSIPTRIGSTWSSRDGVGVKVLKEPFDPGRQDSLGFTRPKNRHRHERCDMKLRHIQGFAEFDRKIQRGDNRHQEDEKLP
ncbi:hypothetical protein AVEN_264021-1 [Araneus ventricosus]|uniref:Uncharacterized protein n=1 Tax=Araneus ventricosus TaxID=182803 RepID=A0A4Y2UXZ7_ARAVE|nr:hypothetical protein AVEN_264021-1 [Araneus ventricosus]